MLPKDVHEYPAITERDDAQGGVVTCPGQPDESMTVTHVAFSIPHHLLTISAVAERSEGQLIRTALKIQPKVSVG